MNEIDYGASDQPCWSCENYVDGCNWSRSKATIPVDGWIAIPVIKHHEVTPMRTYKILYCPEYIDDGTAPPKKVKKPFERKTPVSHPINGTFLAYKMKEIRQSKGISQYRLGMMLDPQVSHGAIQKYENGQRKPSEYMVNKIADALGIKASELILTEEIDNADKTR